MNTDSVSESKGLSYLNITFSEEGVAEYAGRRRVVFIPRGEIRRIEDKVGSGAERPWIQGIAGLILCGVGLVGLNMFVQAGLAYARWEAGFVFFGGLGGWLLWEVLRAKHYLLVTCSAESRKLVFAGRVERPKLDAFLKQAAALGYNFQ